MGDAPEIRTIGFVGLGNMGAPMASGREERTGDRFGLGRECERLG